MAIFCGFCGAHLRDDFSQRVDVIIKAPGNEINVLGILMCSPCLESWQLENEIQNTL